MTFLRVSGTSNSSTDNSLNSTKSIVSLLWEDDVDLEETNPVNKPGSLENKIVLKLRNTE